MVMGIWKIPWEIEDNIDEISNFINSANAQIKHVYREANQLADLITNLAINNLNKIKFSNFSQLPVEAKRILNSDKSQLPYIRIKTSYMHKH